MAQSTDSKTSSVITPNTATPSSIIHTELEPHRWTHIIKPLPDYMKIPSDVVQHPLNVGDCALLRDGGDRAIMCTVVSIVTGHTCPLYTVKFKGPVYMANFEWYLEFPKCLGCELYRPQGSHLPLPKSVIWKNYGDLCRNG